MKIENKFSKLPQTQTLHCSRGKSILGWRRWEKVVLKLPKHRLHLLELALDISLEVVLMILEVAYILLQGFDLRMNIT